MKKKYCIFILIANLFLINNIIADNQQLIDSLLNELKHSAKDEQIKIYKALSSSYQGVSSEKSLEYSKKLLELAIKLKDKETEADALIQLGLAHNAVSDYNQALEYYLQSLKISEELHDTQAISSSYNKIGLVYKKWGKYEEAIEIHLKTLKIAEDLKDSASIAISLSNIGGIYYYWENNEKAIEYFTKAIYIHEELGNTLKVAALGNNIGSVYSELKKYKKAIKFYTKALDVYEEQNIKLGIAIIRDNIGLAYTGLEEYDKAELYVLTSLKLQKELGNKEGMIYSLNNLGLINFKKGNYFKALEYYQKTLPISKELNLHSTLMDNYKTVYEIYYEQRDYKNAIEYYILYTQLKDSIFNENKFNQIAELETKYHTEKKGKEITLLNIEKKLKDAKIKRQTIINYALISGVLALLIIAFQVYNRYRLKHRANYLLRQQNIEIEKQSDRIKSINNDLKSSIRYANRIQSAVMQPGHKLSALFPDSFIFNKPRDIVSGDFYWFMEKKDRIAFTVADCTGHGVPGAFMSMLGLTFINEIYSNYYGLSAAEYLKLLREKIKVSLHQTGEKNEAKDGMDLAFCLYHKKTKILEYAGANNPMYLLRDNKIIQYKADKMPIGIYFREKENFTNHEIKLKKGDSIYLFTDGYTDQFGETHNQKYQANRFKDLLLRIANLDMKLQVGELEQSYLDWKGNNLQVDDILVMGIRV